MSVVVPFLAMEPFVDVEYPVSGAITGGLRVIYCGPRIGEDM